MATIELLRSRPPSRVGLGWAFFERQTNLWKRYWAWEVVWLVYGVVNTLAITFIANEASRSGTVSKGELSRLTMFLLIGTLVWAYMSAVLDDMSLTVMWERWEGTIEHTLMAPVPASCTWSACPPLESCMPLYGRASSWRARSRSSRWTSATRTGRRRLPWWLSGASA